MPREPRTKPDPARSLALLWRTTEPASRKPDADLSVDKIVTTAIHIADTQGLPALTMRAVSDHLGVGTMSTYTYVPGKGELVDLMVDKALGEIAHHKHPGPDWRTRLESVARTNWNLLRAHPWILSTGPRPVLGPNVIAKYDNELRTIDGLPVSDVELDAILTLVLGHTQNTARLAAETAETATKTGQTDAQWWATHAPLLNRILDPTRYPLAHRVGTASGTEHNAPQDPQATFEFGLARLLDGIASFIEGQLEHE
ncbi:TetR/AcrR family transcriptional regulator [Actinokineospora enzanensis]|uniref:TetR/AcrR family transcriptional regulator n=1 Tax=Actinokineospora enzanensis TaxID=155975 RepID=UPI00035F9CAE|nr:TetR/AcrR family transcriptional regulator [Actinokineospora enzanensis]